MVALALASASLLHAGPAVACLACIARPTTTIVDTLIEADAVLLARESPGRPATFAPIALLRGGRPDPISIPIDDVMRERLEDDPQGAALLAHTPEEGWIAIAFAAPPVQRLAEEVLAAAPAWDEDDGSARFAFFAARHDHSDPTVREFALTELSAAPYARIRDLRPRVTGKQIREVLRDPQRAHLAPIHILFLGLSDDPRDHELVRAALATAAKHGVQRNLAAWAIASAEIGGPAAVDRLRALFFDARPNDIESLREVALAFSILRQGGDPALRSGIDAAFRALAADGPPAIAAEVAKQLIWAQDWSQAETFAELLASGALSDPAAEFVVSVYLEAAQEGAVRIDPADDWSLEPR